MAAGASIRGSKEVRQDGDSFRYTGHAQRRVRARNSIFRAVFRSRCKTCQTMISIGSLIKFNFKYQRYTHASCAKANAPMLRARNIIAEFATDETRPHGLKPNTMETYAKEWSKYLLFVERRGRHDVPGRSSPWDMQLLWNFISSRALACKPSSLRCVLSILAHFGSYYGFLLPTSRFDDDAVGYRQLSMMRKQLALDHAQNHPGQVEFGPNQCVGLGKRSVSFLFCAFGVEGRLTFRILLRRHRHHLFCSVMQHSCAMRFGHFLSRKYKRETFETGHSDGSLSLITDWHRYSGTRRYCLNFPAFPEDEFRLYQLRDCFGRVVDTISAATVMRWHFEQLAEADEQNVFAPVQGELCSRADRRDWLRDSFLSALPEFEVKARDKVQEVTPHSFRPGLAGDMLAAGKTMQQIMMHCRWQSERSARAYAERVELTTYRVSNEFVRLSGARDESTTIPNHH